MSNTKSAIMERFNELISQYELANETIDKYKKKKDEILETLNDCVAAGRLFGFDVWKESSLSSPSLPTSERITKTTSPQTVREFILATAQELYPQPVTAKKLRADLERERGEKVHSKTVGMTLYRLSKSGFMRREKYDWYYVPSPERNDPAEAGSLFD